MKIGFLGLGQMGRAMAERLIETGHELIVYNRTRAPAEVLEAKGAEVAADASRVLDAEVVVTMLADDAAIEAVWIAPGLIRRMPASCVHLNMASVSLEMGKQLAWLHREAGNGYVSAPVFGRPHAAAAGQLDIVAAGADAALERCKPLFAVLGKQSFVVGAEPWLANVVKIARNFLLATVVESLGEAFALVRKSGVDPALFFNIITTTSFNAPVYKSYGQRMVEKDFEPTFALKLGLKDVMLALEAGAATGVPLPTADLMRERHLAAIAAGFGDRDWAALGEYIAQDAGLR
ncbi:MAG: NAD(P)-dependent oxidoreductase [Betaproteobacteria bacterium]|nr:NAD(P)-dependent oxidoreductase [Betaproteobacteria bacterium]MDH3436303.1 NAD(P)-dependent oxidoreductase [Betaproteobacteria bacterium]